MSMTEAHLDFMIKLDKRIKIEDKILCHYFLFEHVDFTKSDLKSSFVQIYKDLSTFDSSEVAFNLIITALYHLNIYIGHIDNLCPKEVAKKMCNDISKQRWFFVMLYKECTNEEITKFFQTAFGEIFLNPNCQRYLEKLSYVSIVFNDNFKRIVKDFAADNNLPMLEIYLLEFENGIEYDGKRQRLSGNAYYATVPAKNGVSGSMYGIKEERENLCLVYCNNQRYGWQCDTTKITDTFSNIRGFTVEINPLTTKKIMVESLEFFAKGISANSDMLVCFILTDEKDGHFCDQESNAISVEEILTIFRTSKVPQLGGKPRIYFFDVSHGNSEIELPLKEDLSSANLLPQFDCVVRHSTTTKKHVSIGDYLICSANIQALSPHDDNDGSWFISRICDLISQYSASKRLQDILAMLNKEMSQLFGGATCEIREALTKESIFLEKSK